MDIFKDIDPTRDHTARMMDKAETLGIANADQDEVNQIVQHATQAATIEMLNEIHAMLCYTCGMTNGK